MDLTFATQIENDVTRNLLDTGSRLFVLKHAPETESGYDLVSEGLFDGEIKTGWLMERTRYNEWTLSLACNDVTTIERVRAADAIGYTGIYDPNYIIFEIQATDYPRSASDRTTLFRLAILQVIVGDVMPPNTPIPVTLADTVFTTAELTPKFAPIDASGLGSNEVVAAVTDKKIRVLSYVLVSSGDATAIWESASTALTGPMPLTANSGVSSGFMPVGHFETAAGEALNLNLSAAENVGGHVCYVEV